jgi:predicted GIY-YIG superfamily endonuclease
MAAAILREKRLKKWRRARKLELIDLYDELAI